MASKEWVLIVGGSILQWPAVRAAHELGYRVMLTDQNPECYCADKVDEFVQISTFDIVQHERLAGAHKGDLAAVFTAGADPIVTVARAAEAAGCHGVPVEIAEVCADKHGIRVNLESRNVPQPYYLLAYNEIDFFKVLKDMARYNNLIVKALKGSGSRGHTQLTILGVEAIVWIDLVCRAAYRKAAKFDDKGIVIVEEWLDGKVLSVETLWYNGVMIPLNAVERPFDGIIELGHYNPLVADAETYAAIWDVMGQAGRAVGLGETQGGHIFKGDLIITDEGPKVLELTTRLSGGFDSGWTSPLAHGVDYTKAGLLMALGRPLEEAMPYFAPRWYRHAACMAAFGPKEGGVIKEIKTGGELSKTFGDTIVVYQAGDELPPLIDCTQRVAYCISEGDNLLYARIGARFMSEQVEVICE